MKKIISLLIALFMLIGSIAILTACSGGGGCNVCVDTDGDGICENCNKEIEDDDDGKDDDGKDDDGKDDGGKDDEKGDGGDDEDETPVEITADNWDDLFKFQNVTITMIAEENDDVQSVWVKINGAELQMVMEDSNGSMTYYTDGTNVYMNGEKLEGATADNVSSFYESVVNYTGAFSEFTKKSDGSFVMGDNAIIINVTKGGKLDTIVINEGDLVVNVAFSDWNKTAIDKDYVADNPINGGGNVSPDGPDDSGNTDITDKPGEPGEPGKPGEPGNPDDPGVSEEETNVEINESNWNDLFIFDNVTITLVARYEGEEQMMIVKISGKEIQVTTKGSNNSVVYYTDGKDVYMNGKLFTGATPKQLESMYRDIIDFTDVYDSFTKVSDERFIGKGIPVEINIRNGRLDLVAITDEDVPVTATFSDWGKTVASNGGNSDNGGDGGITDTEFGKLTEEEWKKLFDYDNVTIETAICMNGEQTNLVARIDGSKILLYMSTKNGEATLFTDGKKVYLEGNETDLYTPATVYLIATASANYSEYFNYFTQIDENKFYSESEGIELYLKEGRLFESYAHDGNDNVMVWYTEWGTTVVDKNDSNDTEINCKHYDNDNDRLCDECYQPVKNGGNDVVDKITEESWKNLFVFDNVSIKMEYSAEGESMCLSIQICGDRILYQEFESSGYKCDVYYDGKTVYLNGVETSEITLEDIYSWFIEEIDFSEYYDLFINEGGNRFYSEDLGLTIFVEAGKLQNIYYDDDNFSFRADFFEWGNTIINYTPNTENNTDCAHIDYDKDGRCDNCSMPMPIVDTDTDACAHIDDDCNKFCDLCGNYFIKPDVNNVGLTYKEWVKLFDYKNVTIKITERDFEYDATYYYTFKIDGNQIWVMENIDGYITVTYTDGEDVYVNGKLDPDSSPDGFYSSIRYFFDHSDCYDDLEQTGAAEYYCSLHNITFYAFRGTISSFCMTYEDYELEAEFSNYNATAIDPNEGVVEIDPEWAALFEYENVTINIVVSDGNENGIMDIKIDGDKVYIFSSTPDGEEAYYTDGESAYYNGVAVEGLGPEDVYTIASGLTDWSEYQQIFKEVDPGVFYCEAADLTITVIDGQIQSMVSNKYMENGSLNITFSNWGTTVID